MVQMTDTETWMDQRYNKQRLYVPLIYAILKEKSSYIYIYIYIIYLVKMFVPD